jgi:hypothetical protein
LADIPSKTYLNKAVSPLYAGPELTILEKPEGTLFVHADWVCERLENPFTLTMLNPKLEMGWYEAAFRTFDKSTVSFVIEEAISNTMFDEIMLHVELHVAALMSIAVGVDTVKVLGYERPVGIFMVSVTPTTALLTREEGATKTDENGAV